MRIGPVLAGKSLAVKAATLALSVSAHAAVALMAAHGGSSIEAAAAPGLPRAELPAPELAIVDAPSIDNSSIKHPKNVDFRTIRLPVRIYVGARNSLRFPSYFRLEAGIERQTKILKFRPWLGVRVWNALDAFLPVDVQSNLGSPNYGKFYNSEYPQIRIIMRFER